mmetsp:Transcript_100/g.168  ORF Transcript_100/g.168 Transcript_100/m.168 type:complete len:301 (+) Transcript_100:964-1866(+)
MESQEKLLLSDLPDDILVSILLFYHDNQLQISNPSKYSPSLADSLVHFIQLRFVSSRFNSLITSQILPKLIRLDISHSLPSSTLQFSSILKLFTRTHSCSQLFFLPGSQSGPILVSQLNSSVESTHEFTARILKLHLSMCTSLSMIDLNVFENLRVLHLDGCRSLTDSCFESIETGLILYNLIQLSLRWCVSIGNQSVQIIGNQCKSLKTLDIHGCDNINDDGIYRLLRGDSELYLTLEYIDLCFCSISDNTLHYLDSCHRLHTLRLPYKSENLWNCGTWTYSRLQKLRSTHPSLRVLFD